MIPLRANKTLSFYAPQCYNYQIVMFFCNGYNYFLGRGIGIEFLWEYFRNAQPNARIAITYRYQQSLIFKKSTISEIIYINYNIQNILQAYRMIRNFINKRLFSTVNLKLNVQKKYVEVTLTNSKKRNPLSSDTMNELYEKLIQVEKYAINEQARLLFLKAQGPVFSAGHDLKELQASKNPSEIFDLCTSLMLRLRSVSIPTICAANGVVAAAGFQLSMACDILIATQNSTFSCPGIKWGLFCSTPGVQLVRAINSQKKANQMLLFGESITAQEGYTYGLVNKVLQNQEALNKQIQSYVQKANHLSSDVVKFGKKTLIEQRTHTVEQAYQIAGKAMHENITHKPDCRQGLAAFSQKRKPHYKH